ncbi:MAG: hypothetical protein KAV00_06995 [Phycisphaerae bacterium]|nr:hypothetical protein [Phycisphaerae bacterium]
MTDTEIPAAIKRAAARITTAIEDGSKSISQVDMEWIIAEELYFTKDSAPDFIGDKERVTPLDPREGK